jgi:tetratricopeptide (TPR) repeat protein
MRRFASRVAWTRIPLAGAVLACAAGIARAQHERAPALGFERDCDLAQRLSERGEREHSVAVIDRVKKSPGLTDVQKATIAFTEATVSVAAFEREKDYEKANALYEIAKRGIDEYLRLAPKGSYAVSASYLKGDLGRNFGEKVVEQIKRETSAEKIGELRKRGEEAFKSAEEHFKAKAEALKPLAGDRESAEYREYLAALYAVPNCYYSHAFLFPEGDPGRQLYLERADRDFQEEFFLAVDESLKINFEALVKAGNVNRELGRVDAAINYYQSAMEALYFFPDPNDPSTKTVVPAGELDPGEISVVLEASAEAAKLHNKLKQPKEVIKRVAELRKAIPKLEQYEQAGGFLIELALAYEAEGSNEKAIEAASAALSAAGIDSPAGRGAVEVLDRLGGGPGGKVRTVSRAEVLGAVAKAYGDKNYGEAIRLFHRTAARIHGTSGAEFLPALLYLAGHAYRDGGRPLEAIVVWRSVGDRFPEHKLAADALGWLVIQVCETWEATNGTWPERIAAEALADLEERFPGSQAATGAQSRYVKTLAKMGKKDPAEVARVVEAQIEKVAETDPTYGSKWLELARMWMNAGITASQKSQREEARQHAVKAFEKFLAWAEKTSKSTIDPGQLSKLEEQRVESLQGMASTWIWEPGANPEKALALVQQVEEAAAKSTSARVKQLLTKADDVKLRALLLQGKLDQAITVADGLVQKAPESGVAVMAARRVAEAADKEASKVKQAAGAGNGDKQRFDQLLDWAIRDYGRWIQNGEKQPGRIGADEYETAGTSIFKLGMWKNGIDWKTSFFQVDSAKLAYKEPLAKAAELFQKAIEANEVARDSKFDEPLTRFKLGQVLGLQASWKGLASEYSKLAERSGALETADGGGAYALKVSPEVKKSLGKVPIHQTVNEWAYAQAQLAEKGDKKAGTEAQSLAGAVETATNPGSKEGTEEWWMARYVAVLAAYNNGEYKTVTDKVEYYRTTDKELDQDKFGFKTKILDLFERARQRVGTSEPPPPKRPK